MSKTSQHALQGLLDFEGSRAQNYANDDASASMYVDILTAGEVINVSQCGRVSTNTIQVQMFAPSNNSTPVFDQTLADANLGCSNPMTAPLTNPLRHTTKTGAYRLVLQNTSATGFSSLFKRYDISVIPDAVTNPDPTVAAARLRGYTFGFNAAGFGEAQPTYADYYELIHGGRPNSNYVCQLDLNNLAGYGYNLLANSIGLDDPNSGYSDDKTGNTVSL